jgi:hypothetical protein
MTFLLAARTKGKLMKLYPALKDPGMKFPRLSNAFLDIGMFLLLSGGLAIGGVVLGMIPSEPYGYRWALGTFVMGFAFDSVSAWLSKLRKPLFVPPKVGLKLVD